MNYSTKTTRIQNYEGKRTLNMLVYFSTFYFSNKMIVFLMFLDIPNADFFLFTRKNLNVEQQMKSVLITLSVFELLLPNWEVWEFLEQDVF